MRAGLTAGLELDRARARLLRRELRRSEALQKAMRELRFRDRSTARLRERLAAAHVPAQAAEEALAALTRAGLADDARMARARATSLAERGAGDAAIRHDLEQQGLEAPVVEEALAELEPEEARAARVVEARGASLATARRLARKGFSTESIEHTVGDAVARQAPRAVL